LFLTIRLETNYLKIYWTFFTKFSAFVVIGEDEEFETLLRSLNGRCYGNQVLSRCEWKEKIIDDKKLCYRRRTARRAMSIEIFSGTESKTTMRKTENLKSIKRICSEVSVNSRGIRGVSSEEEKKSYSGKD